MRQIETSPLRLSIDSGRQELNRERHNFAVHPDRALALLALRPLIASVIRHHHDATLPYWDCAWCAPLLGQGGNDGHQNTGY